MHKARPHHAFRHKHVPAWRHTPYLGMCAIAGISSGVLYRNARVRELNRSAKKLTAKIDGNIMRNEPRLRDFYAKALRNKTPEEKFARETLVANGGEQLGQMQYQYFWSMFYANGVPFREPYVTMADYFFVGEAAREMAEGKPQFAEMLDEWASIRLLSFGPTPPRKGETEIELMGKVREGVGLTKEMDVQDKSGGEVPWHAALVGTASGAGLLGLMVLIELAVAFKRKISGAAMRKALDGGNGLGEGKPRWRRRGSVQGGDITREAAIEITPSTREEACESVEAPARRNGDGKADRAKAAREHLKEIFGAEFSDTLMGALNGNISVRMAAEIETGNYGPLIRWLASNKKALELRGLDVNGILNRFEGEDSEPAECGPAITTTGRRRWHPLDAEQRWGRQPADIHRLLAKWGFDVGERTGGGHRIVKYDEIPLRRCDGRFVLVKAAGSRTEMTPKWVHEVLRDCARFLVEKEDEEKKKERMPSS